MSQTPVKRKFMDFQANQIDTVLAVHRVPARVQGGNVTPRWFRYHLNTSPGARVSVVRNLSEELALALGANQVRIARDGYNLTVEVPRSDSSAVYLLDLMEQFPMNETVAPCIGVGDDGRSLHMRLHSPDIAHALVAGTTGSGKTELMRTIVWSLASTNRCSQLQLVLIDPKCRGFGTFRTLPHLLAPVVTRPSAALRLLERLTEEMERRDRENIQKPHIVVVVDEVADLLNTAGKVLESYLIRLAQRGREAGIHLILGTQSPSSEVFSSLLKANFPLRLVGKVSSANDARVAAGIAGTNAEQLVGQGDFLAISSGRVTHFQAAYVPTSHYPELQKRIAQKAGRL
ncbi:MAG TPA: DNA translocase FtsK [Anaerolineales bacterium]|nr:DNA translocase FtsK [Anaerolineales bacterium]